MISSLKNNLFLSTKNTVQQPLLTAQQAVLFFVYMVAFVIVLSLIKKLYYRYQLKKRYFVIPKLGIKGLSYLSMVIAVSVSIVIILAVVSSGAANALFRAFPSSRVAVEAVLIKIGGLLFGPILGMFIGAGVDSLTIALTGGTFHYGYLISAMAFGLISGFIRTLITYSKGADLKMALYSSITVIVVYALLTTMLYLIPAINDPMSFRFLKESDGRYLISIDLKKSQVTSFLGGLFFLLISLIWITYFMSKKEKYKYVFKTFVPVLLVVIVSELILNLIMLPAFDAEIINIDYWLSFTARIGTLPVVTFVNITVLWTVYRIIAPLIKYDYTTELHENLTTPLNYE